MRWIIVFAVHFERVFMKIIEFPLALGIKFNQLITCVSDAAMADYCMYVFAVIGIQIM